MTGGSAIRRKKTMAMCMAAAYMIRHKSGLPAIARNYFKYIYTKNKEN